MRIAVYGANGYQGRLAVAELVRRGLVPVLIGRSRARLESAARTLGLAEPDLRVAPDGRALIEVLRDVAAVVDCAGPFTAKGRSVVEAAIEAGCPYVDTAGEQLYLHDLFESLHRRAADAGVAVVPAATEGALPGDLLAHLLAEELGEELAEELGDDPGGVEEMAFGYRLTAGGTPSRGTVRSALGSMDALRSGGLGYDAGEWTPEVAPLRAEMAFGRQPAVPVVRFPLQEVVTVPRHVPVRRVQGFVERSLATSLTGEIAPALVDALPEGPSESERLASRFALTIEAVGRGGERRRGLVEGVDTYGSTAVIAVEAARRLATAGDGRAGVLAPSQAFDPRDFLDWLASNSTVRTDRSGYNGLLSPSPTERRERSH